MGDRHAAVQFFNQGVTSAQDRSRPEFLTHAYQQFVSACYADPTWGNALYYAGNHASDLGHLHTAVACWRRALETDLKDVLPHDSQDADRAKVYCNLGWRLQSLGQMHEALDATERSLRLDPDLAFSHLNRAIILYHLGHTKESVVAARRAYELKPDDSTVQFGLGFSLLFDRQLAEGFKFFEARFAHRLVQFTHYPYPRWQGERDKTVFLVADQGLGDTLSFARFVRRACEVSRYVHACVQPELLRLFQYAFIDVPNLNLLPSPANFPAADAWSTFVSLPFALGLTDDEIRNAPHIAYNPPSHVRANWRVTDRKLHIGIAWRGSALNDINEHRSIPVTEFLELYRVPGVQLYSLQVDGNKDHLQQQGCAPVIRDLSGYIRDVYDTLAVLRDLDLVVTCESALGHICTLANKTVWVPYSYQGLDYRVGWDGRDQLWSNYRVFKQGPDSTWKPVFTKIVEALQKEFP